jgi:hypothetical protein
VLAEFVSNTYLYIEIENKIVFKFLPQHLEQDMLYHKTSRILFEPTSETKPETETLSLT